MPHPSQSESAVRIVNPVKRDRVVVAIKVEPSCSIGSQDQVSCKRAGIRVNPVMGSVQ
jgi:hypothetical protein